MVRKAIPKIKDIIPSITEMCKHIHKLPNVKNVYAWRILLKNINSSESRIKRY
jgi:hypothetical protein